MLVRTVYFRDAEIDEESYYKFSANPKGHHGREILFAVQGQLLFP